MKLITAAYTPLDRDLSLKTSTISDYYKYLLNKGIDGVFLNGSTGDFTSLRVEERMTLLEEWSKTIDVDNFYLINHVGSNSLEEAKDLARHSIGLADAISALPPFYFHLNSIEQLVDYCEELAAVTPHLPFYYYHIPVLSNANFKMSEFLKLVEKRIPTFKGIKFTHTDILDYQDCVEYVEKNNLDYELFFGVDEMFMTSLPFNESGWVGSTYNHFPEVYREIQKCFEEKDYKKGRDLQQKAKEFVNILQRNGGYNGLSKSLMKLYGVDCGPSRFPHKTPTDEVVYKVVEEIDAIGINLSIKKQLSTL